MGKAAIPALHELARLYGVQTAYYDVSRRRQHASPPALLPVLRALGAPLESLADVPAALRQRHQALWERGVEPVAVAWEGEPGALELRRPCAAADTELSCRLALETGEVRSWSADLGKLAACQAAEVEGVRYVAKRLSLPEALPRGYHRLTLEGAGERFESTVIVAPRRAYGPPESAPGGRTWGVFLPVYALRSGRSWGTGDLTDLEALVAWAAGLGGAVVGTLPLLASFLDTPFEPSPYAPASRLFWNELYVDPTRAPELARCPRAQALLGSAELQADLADLRKGLLVDYRRAAATKRAVLAELARCFFAERNARSDAYRCFREAHPQVEDYARFRATCERRRAGWPAWPAPLRDGELTAGEYDEEAALYHLYVQWLAHEQLRALGEKARAAQAQLYLDLPLGVHPDSYDVWREREAFALDICGGAPPDTFFTQGQNWGFPPLHPERSREQGYRYLVACLRHHLAHAGLLRIDHVMGLHRLYWVPRGLEARDGVYVRYRAEELYAILSLESHRHRSLIVGEDLGTVPRAVRAAMARHNLHRIYVAQHELSPEPRRPLRPVPRAAVASLNTHDMPTFAAFWEGLDIQDRQALGLLDEAGARQERRRRRALKEALARFLDREGRLAPPNPPQHWGGRVGGEGGARAQAVVRRSARTTEQVLARGEGEATARAVLRACLAHLSASLARVVLINLEDLWLETRPQNVPGTWQERPNWQRKASYSIEELAALPDVLDALRQIDHLRTRERGLH